jgi:hypothetical protein
MKAKDIHPAVYTTIHRATQIMDVLTVHQKHQTQHNELFDCEEQPVPESKKVISNSTSLGNSLAHIYRDHNLLTHFDSCQKYLQTIAASTRVHQVMQGRDSNREVSSAEKEARGRGKPGGGKKRKPVHHNEYISLEKWKKLSHEKWSAVFTKQEKDNDNGKGYKKLRKGKTRVKPKTATV